MDRVEKILNWTLDCGMVAIINIHHENEWINKYPPTASKENSLPSGNRYVNASKSTVTTYCSSQ